MSTLTSTLPAKPDAQEPPLPLAQGDLRTTLRPVAFGLLVAGVGGLFLLELMIGVVPIPLSEILALLVGAEVAQAAWSTILYELRLPRAITALVGGAALGAAGLQLQTLFRNPLAGPWALGITAGAQLGVALVVVAGGVVGSTFLEQFVFLNNLS
ncbi:MAG: iron chelate uptake ABC transporter family permease subunit, partial [Bacteroidota bacterium]